MAAVSRELDRRVRFELMFEAVSGAHPGLSRETRRAIAKTRLKNLKVGLELPPLPKRGLRPVAKGGKNLTGTYRRGFNDLTEK